MKTLRIVNIVALMFAMTIPTASAEPFDGLLEIQRELQFWEETRAIDFSDVNTQLDELADPSFVDVFQEDWFYLYVTSLADWGIVSGYKDENGVQTGQYRPANNVTVAEFLKLAIEAAQIDIDTCASTPAHPQALDHWAKLYVGCAEDAGARLFDTILPADLNRTAKRAEVLTIIHDIFNDDVPPVYALFTDTEGHRFEADIAFANLYGIVKGDTDGSGLNTGTFRPDDPVNRAEAAKIIYEKLRLNLLKTQEF